MTLQEAELKENSEQEKEEVNYGIIFPAIFHPQKALELIENKNIEIFSSLYYVYNEVEEEKLTKEECSVILKNIKIDKRTKKPTTTFYQFFFTIPHLRIKIEQLIINQAIINLFIEENENPKEREYLNADIINSLEIENAELSIPPQENAKLLLAHCRPIIKKYSGQRGEHSGGKH
uniref:Uncharacterized protein n=1 Tax=Meloidogyne hapla TaxID=6305 RepID=A0A1I8BN54_MELHA